MDHKRPIKTGFYRSGPVFLSSRIKKDWSRSRSFNFRPKDQTGPDLQTLIIIKYWKTQDRYIFWVTHPAGGTSSRFLTDSFRKWA